MREVVRDYLLRRGGVVHTSSGVGYGFRKANVLRAPSAVGGTFLVSNLGPLIVTGIEA